MLRRSFKTKRVHGVGNSEDTEIVIANERLHASGVFSNVYQAQMLLPTAQKIAIKKVWFSKTTAKAAEQEIELLKQLNHPNVVSLLYHFELKTSDETCECLVFDFLPSDLSRLRQKLAGRRFDPLDAKLYAWQMYEGLNYVHSCGITHCDLKPSNLIVDEEHGLLKLADFGNAKILKKGDPQNSYQVTRYYRAPELIFGATEFTMSIDRWAAACVLAELHLGRPFLCGSDNTDQGRLIIDLLGYPTSDQIKAMNVKKPKFSRKKARGFGPLVANTNFPPLALDIVNRSLVYEPDLRMSIDSILAHAFFNELRENPRLKRANGTSIPPLNYWTE
ncbi:Protein kinase domain-containing protein [Aphelenchoides bicaudatus]|nr:Protein kinase domain-containing protein [Aphelenchoides bicaudatus]